VVIRGEPTRSEEAGTLDVLAGAIEAGQDGIEIPPELTEEIGKDEPSAIPEGLFVRVRHMTVGERLKLALRGNKEARTLLLRDSNRVIVRLVLRNPRITEDEIIGITNNRSIDDELLRMIGERREWTKNYQVRAGLVSNPRTPIALAIRFLPTLDDRDIRRLAKSRNVPEAVAGAARRMVASRQSRSR